MIRLCTLLLLMLSVGQAWGATITIVNPGFEDDSLSDGANTGGNGASGWSGAGSGAYNPNTAGYPGEAPEGLNVGWINGPTSVTPVTSLWQTIAGHSITDGLTYTLSLQVGYRQDISPARPNYTVELRAGGESGTILASANQTDAFPSSGSFSPLELSFTADGTYAGQALTIRMTSAGVQTNFDDLSLNAVPLPAAAWLFGSALLGLVGVARRRQA